MTSSKLRGEIVIVTESVVDGLEVSVLVALFHCVPDVHRVVRYGNDGLDNFNFNFWSFQLWETPRQTN